ncbi:MAG TPA: hypothetical protein VGM87_22575 [Roseomonas sp.]|jgi:hypothetical protein
MRACLFAILILAGFVPAAMAQNTTTLAQANGWEAFQIPPGPNGPGLCGMGTSANNRGRFIWIKVERQQGVLVGFVQLGQTNWTVADSVRGRLHILIDGRVAELHYRGTSRGTTIEASYSGAFNNFINFVESFASGYRMEVRFPEDDIEPWTADLRGTRAVTNAFVACARRI